MPHEIPTSRRAAIAAFAGATAAICCGDHALGETKYLPVDRLNDSSVGPVDVHRAAISPPGAPAGLLINPRSAWDTGRPPRWSMGAEDVKFLLVHHTGSNHFVSNPAAVIRSVYDFHTSAEKGWPDVAYNFFIAPDGSVWEGRAGSLAGPVVADATGGNQGFSQLVCLIGNHEVRPPSIAAQISLVRTLAWLSMRHNLSPWAGAEASFVSRGSDKFPAGSAISTPIISPHRAVTFTACPGDAAVSLLRVWRQTVFNLVETTWQRPDTQPATRINLQRP